jgi:hypothetical protein
MSEPGMQQGEAVLQKSGNAPYFDPERRRSLPGERTRRGEQKETKSW